MLLTSVWYKRRAGTTEVIGFRGGANPGVVMLRALPQELKVEGVGKTLVVMRVTGLSDPGMIKRRRADGKGAGRKWAGLPFHSLSEHVRYLQGWRGASTTVPHSATLSSSCKESDLLYVCCLVVVRRGGVLDAGDTLVVRAGAMFQ